MSDLPTLKPGLRVTREQAQHALDLLGPTGNKAEACIKAVVKSYISGQLSERSEWLESADIDTDLKDILETAWGIISYSYAWNSDVLVLSEWRDAAARWRDRYYEYLDTWVSNE